MKRTGSRGMMGLWADIDPDYAQRFREWHNCEHIPERVSIPGFNAGRRYNGLDGAPFAFMFYETDDSAVFGSKPYLDRLGDPTPWTRESLAHFRNGSRNVYALVAEQGEPAPLEAPYVLTCRFGLAPEGEQAALDWHAAVWLPAVAALSEVYRARLWRLDEDISGISTAERELHRSGPGKQRYLALCETTCPAPHRTDAWSAAEAALANAAPHLEARRDWLAESFWLDMALYAP